MYILCVYIFNSIWFLSSLCEFFLGWSSYTLKCPIRIEIITIDRQLKHMNRDDPKKKILLDG